MKFKTPYAAIVPPLSTDEQQALKADIAANGILVPILVDEAGNILDGHHRYKLRKKGQKVPTRVIEGLSEPEKRAMVIRTALVRRNLSPEQKAELRRLQQEIAALLRQQGQTQAEVALHLGVAQQTVVDWERISNTGSGKANTDCRVSVPKPKRAEIAKRVQAGETQRQVAADVGVSQGRVAQIVKQERQRAAAEQSVKDLASRKRTSDAPVEVLLADPPWQYEFAETQTREIENHYPTATAEDIATHLSQPWAPRIAVDCVLFMWATAPKLREAFVVLDGWEFDYKTHAVWDKQRVGMGYWFRGQHELLLVATRGKVAPPDPSVRHSSVFSERRDSKHSRKPVCVYEAIEAMFPHACKAELYQRKPRKGWHGFGNEA